MKKTLSLLTVSIAVLSIACGLLFTQIVGIQNENSELKNELFDANTQLEAEQNASLQLEVRINELEEQLINRVNITDFRTEGDFPPVNGVWWYSDSIVFVVTVENFGINDVNNLSVVFTEPTEGSINFGTLKAGQSKTVSISYELGDNGFYARHSTLATLMMDNKILDKQNLLETIKTV